MSAPPRGGFAASRVDRRTLVIALGAIAAAVAAYLLSQTYTGLAEDPRVLNPLAPADTTIEWAGKSTTGFWVPIFYGVTLLVMAWMSWVFVKHKRRTGARHPALPLFMAFWIGIVADPILNWAMYCNYNPSLLHWDTSWFVFNVAPNVEPVWIVMGAYQVFFVGPAILGFWFLSRFVIPRAKPDGFLRRRPVLAVFLIVAPFGFLMDFLMEIWMLNMGIYKYTQIFGPTVAWGEGNLQLFEIIVVGLMIALYASLMNRDDTGSSVCARFARDNRLARRLHLGEYGVALVVVGLSLGAYGAFWTTARVTYNATNVPSSPYPFKESKTYDPDGLMQRSGQPEPYFVGTWCVSDRCARS